MLEAKEEVERLAGERRELEDGKAETLKQLAATTEGKVAAEAGLAAKETEAAALREELGAAKEKAQALQGALEEQEAATGKAEAAVSEVEARLVESEADKTGALGKVQELETRLSSTADEGQQQLSEANTKIAQLHETLKDVTGKLASATQEKVGLEGEVGELKSALERAGGALEEERSQASVAAAAADEAAEVARRLHEEVEARCAELEELLAAAKGETEEQAHF